MAKVSFDGPNQLIHILPGVTTVDVAIDMYSEWKEWLLLTDNMKYLSAFRSVGGDPTNPDETQFAPRYFFLINGWRVKVDGQTIVVQLNLYTEEGGSPFIVTGNGAVTNRGSDAPVSVTELPEIQYASYNGGVSYDPTSPWSGIDFPIGTPLKPVNNIIDAGIIAHTKGFNKGFLLTYLDMDDSVPLEGFTMIGRGGQKTVVTLRPAATVLDCCFFECFVSGELDGNCRLANCIVGELNLGYGFLDRCILTSTGIITLTIGNGNGGYLFDCYSDISAIHPPVIDCGGSGQSLIVRNYNGTLKLINKTGPESISIDLNSGNISLDMTTVTGGKISVRGVGYLLDYNTKLQIPSGTYGDLEIINETVNTGSIASSTINTLFYSPMASGGTFSDSFSLLPVINNNSLIAATESTLARKLQSNKAVISDNERLVTVYDDDGITILYQFDVSDDKYIRTPR
jgi:hypothetical protein